jgi:chitodextrinase
MAVIKIVPMPGAKGDQGDDGATGAQGLQGPIGETGPAGADALWSYNGAWQSNAAYAVGDLVTYQGQLYYAKAITTAGTLPTDTSKFDLIAAKGVQGIQGETGPQGPQGETGPAGADAAWYYNGAYNPGAGYAVGDVVTYEGQTWYRKHANGGNVGDTPSEGLFWDLVAAKGSDGTELNFWNFAGDPGVPTVDGALVTDGLSARSGGNVTIHATTGGKVVVAGDGGEFLFDSNVPANQIATLGDLPTGVNSSFTIGNQTFNITNGIITSIDVNI